MDGEMIGAGAVGCGEAVCLILEFVVTGIYGWYSWEGVNFKGSLYGRMGWNCIGREGGYRVGTA